MKKNTKTTETQQRSRVTALADRDLARAGGGKEDAGIHAQSIGGGGDQPIETA